MDRFKSMAEDQLLQIDTIYNLYSGHLKELGSHRSLSLRKSGSKDGRAYYYSFDHHTGKRRYLGTDANDEVRLIKEVRFCKDLVKRAEMDMRLLRRVIDEYRPLDYDAVNEGLPRTYRGAEIAFDSQIKADKRAEKWIRHMKALKNSVPVIYPEDLKHTAIDGTQVRSKSELSIANLLFTNNIPYVYECPYFFDDEIIRFDFTALSTIDYESKIIIEHQGLMDLDSYRGKYMHTLMTCLRNGIAPNIDIFFTFDDIYGNLDSRQIWDIINTKLKQ